MCARVGPPPFEPAARGVQRSGQAGAVAGVVPQGDHGRDVGPQQLPGEAAVVGEQGGVGPRRPARRHHGRPVEGEVEVGDAHPADLLHLGRGAREGRER